ncbi:DUF3347 domain-containing protein [Salegentibacter sp. F188]|uniref:DUF3347 domain-containing protein n=1 Tax=Autumnicola patrickiae TaxID=3075591 RepID=A0ABU3E7C4_9FLAO|nr:DUF3347 domain-containing protein [Salegentibacter sp. F188]MDT0691895.1 DUF3347 domain-containing protein [Salegentibacter sp. F188]
MKNSLIIFSTVVGVLSLSSCGETKKEQDTTMPMQNDSRMSGEVRAPGNLDDGEATGNPEFEDEEMATVYGWYLEIKSALVNSNPTEAREAAKNLKDALQAMKEAENALEASKEIAKTANLNIQRIAFSDLSATMEDILEGELTSGKIYKQFCPMAFGGVGDYWFASSKEVRNPYIGERMLDCGRVADSIQ